MKTVIFCSGCRFPFSVVAGAILIGMLPPVFDANTFWSAGCRDMFYKNVLDNAHYMGNTADGTSVLILSAPSAGHLLANLSITFLDVSGINKDLYSIVELEIQDKPVMKLGHLLLRLPLTRRAGKRLLEKFLPEIYPRLVEAVKLDGNFQISDN